MARSEDPGIKMTTDGWEEDFNAEAVLEAQEKEGLLEDPTAKSRRHSQDSASAQERVGFGATDLASERQQSPEKPTTAIAGGWEVGVVTDREVAGENPSSSFTEPAGQAEKDLPDSPAQAPDTPAGAPGYPEPADGWEEPGIEDLGLGSTANLMSHANLMTQPPEETGHEVRGGRSHTSPSGLDEEVSSTVPTEASSGDAEVVPPWHRCWTALLKREIELGMCETVLHVVDQADCALFSPDEGRELVDLVNSRGDAQA